MTKKQKTIAAAGALVVLLIGGYYGAKAYRTARFQKLTSSMDTAIPLAGLQSDKVVRIEVPTAGLVLEKKEDTWVTVPESSFLLDQDEISSLTWSLSNMRADKLIDEDPKDLAIYGLDSPKAHVVVRTSEGTGVEYFAGNMAPSKSGYYVMVGGDPKVYLAPSYPGERLYLTAGAVRDKKLPTYEPAEVRHFVLESGGRKIEIESKPEGETLYSSFTSHLLTSPYKTPRGIDPERFNAILSFFHGLTIRDFVDDNPASLAPYGLDRPSRVFVQDGTSSLHLLVGNRMDGANRLYAKLAASPAVFTIDDVGPALAAEPFDLVDKFAMIIGIDNVDMFTVKAEGKTLTGEIRREKATVDGQEETRETYFLDGKKAEEKSFKDFYQSCIGLMVDAEHPSPSAVSGAAEVVIEYRLNKPAGRTAAIRLLPYNRDFHALGRDGAVEFLVSRTQVNRIFEAAENIKPAE